MAAQLLEGDEAAKIFKRHELGRDALKQFPKDTRARHGSKKKYAADHGVTTDLLDKSLAFAELFTVEEVRRLVYPEDGKALGWAFFRRLVSIADRKQRMETAHRAMTEMWTVIELGDEIERKIGKRGQPHAGRRFKRPTDLNTRWLRICGATESWLKTVASMQPLPKPTHKRLSTRTRRVLQELRSVADQLARVVAE